MLGLNSIHILEYMQHIRPLDYDRIPLTDLLSGDYLAFLDNEGVLLHRTGISAKDMIKTESLYPGKESNFQEYNASGLFPMHIRFKDPVGKER